MFINHKGARGLQARFDGGLHQLIEDDGTLRYTSPLIDLHMDPKTLNVVTSAILDCLPDDRLVDSDHLGAMITLYRSFAESMPEFPLTEVDRSQML